MTSLNRSNPGRFWQDLTRLVTGQASPDAPEEADFWRYAESAGPEPNPLRRNVLQWRRLILLTPNPVATLAGQPVQVTGYVKPPETATPNLFELVRPVIRCCLDDTAALGIPVLAPEAPKVKAGTWLQIQGVWVPGWVNQRETLVVQPHAMQSISPPEKQYINGVF